MNNDIDLAAAAYSSLTVASLAAIIPDTAIVSIAGSTLSKITTTTSSTATVPTPQTVKTNQRSASSPSASQTPIKVLLSTGNSNCILEQPQLATASTNAHNLNDMSERAVCNAGEQSVSLEMNSTDDGNDAEHKNSQLQSQTELSSLKALANCATPDRTPICIALTPDSPPPVPMTSADENGVADVAADVCRVFESDLTSTHTAMITQTHVQQKSQPNHLQNALSGASFATTTTTAAIVPANALPATKLKSTATGAATATTPRSPPKSCAHEHDYAPEMPDQDQNSAAAKTINDIDDRDFLHLLDEAYNYRGEKHTHTKSPTFSALLNEISLQDKLNKSFSDQRSQRSNRNSYSSVNVNSIGESDGYSNMAGKKKQSSATSGSSANNEAHASSSGATQHSTDNSSSTRAPKLNSYQQLNVNHLNAAISKLTDVVSGVFLNPIPMNEDRIKRDSGFSDVVHEAVRSTSAEILPQETTRYVDMDSNSVACKSIFGGPLEVVVKPKDDQNGASGLKDQTKDQNVRPIDVNGNSVSNGILNNTNAASEIDDSLTHTTKAAGKSNSTATSAANNNNVSSSSGLLSKKGKPKKKPQHERNVTTVTAASVEGNCGYKEVSELVKYIESGSYTEQNKSGKGADGNKKKERRRERENKNHQPNKSNSLEELRSCSKIDVNDLKRGAATTESNASSSMRNKHVKAGGKQNSSSAADINIKVNESKSARSLPLAGLKREELKALTNIVKIKNNKNQSNNNNNNANKFAPKDVQCDSNANIATEAATESSAQKSATVTDSLEAMPGQQLGLTVASPTISRSNDNGTTPTYYVEDESGMNAALRDSSEFLLVTNKRKHARKARPPVEEVIPVSAAGVSAHPRSGNNGQQQQLPRVQSANCRATAPTLLPTRVRNNTAPHASDGNNMHSVNYSQRQQHHQLYHKSYLHQQSQPPLQAQTHVQIHSQSQLAQQQHASTSKYCTSKINQDESSRRKSSSSMPASEKSESSDLDSVHSLPVQTLKKNGKQRQIKNSERKEGSQRKESTPVKNTEISTVSYAEIARISRTVAANKRAAASEAAKTQLPSTPLSGGANKSKLRNKAKPNFPELTVPEPISIHPPVEAATVAQVRGTSTELPKFRRRSITEQSTVQTQKAPNALSANNSAQPQSRVVQTQTQMQQRAKNNEPDESNNGVAHKTNIHHEQYPSLNKLSKRCNFISTASNTTSALTSTATDHDAPDTNYVLTLHDENTIETHKTADAQCSPPPPPLPPQTACLNISVADSLPNCQNKYMLSETEEPSKTSTATQTSDLDCVPKGKEQTIYTSGKKPAVVLLNDIDSTPMDTSILFGNFNENSEPMERNLVDNFTQMSSSDSASESEAVCINELIPASSSENGNNNSSTQDYTAMNPYTVKVFVDKEVAEAQQRELLTTKPPMEVGKQKLEYLLSALLKATQADCASLEEKELSLPKQQQVAASTVKSIAAHHQLPASSTSQSHAQTSQLSKPPSQAQQETQVQVHPDTHVLTQSEELTEMEMESPQTQVESTIQPQAQTEPETQQRVQTEVVTHMQLQPQASTQQTRRYGQSSYGQQQPQSFRRYSQQHTLRRSYPQTPRYAQPQPQPYYVQPVTPPRYAQPQTQRFSQPQTQRQLQAASQRHAQPVVQQPHYQLPTAVQVQPTHVAPQTMAVPVQSSIVMQPGMYSYGQSYTQQLAHVQPYAQNQSYDVEQQDHNSGESYGSTDSYTDTEQQPSGYAYQTVQYTAPSGITYYSQPTMATVVTPLPQVLPQPGPQYYYGPTYQQPAYVNYHPPQSQQRGVNGQPNESVLLNDIATDLHQSLGHPW